MPGPEGFGPAGKWVHDRAHRIMEEGDTQEEYGSEKGKQVAYAIATQQAHKVGKSPKDFRTPSGVHEAKQKYDEPKAEYQKSAASREGARLMGFVKSRSKIRSHRLHNLLDKLMKTSSEAGQDLRVPVMGGGKFPTGDSKGLATSLLNQGRSATEVGPSPDANQLGKTGPKIKDMVPSYGTTKGDLPDFNKKGSIMSSLMNDPLIQYLKKQAEEGLKEELGTDDPGVVMPGSPVSPVQFSEDFLNGAVDHRDNVLRTLFDNHASAKKRGL